MSSIAQFSRSERYTFGVFMAHMVRPAVGIIAGAIRVENFYIGYKVAREANKPTYEQTSLIGKAGSFITNLKAGYHAFKTDLDGKRPVFFYQKRIGFQAELFDARKFCTMVDRRDEDGNRLKDEYCVTWLGSLLRKAGIDELANNENIIRREMNWLGWRPPQEGEVANLDDRHQKMFDVIVQYMPGVTGWAQTRKGIDRTAGNQEAAAQKIAAEYDYRMNYSILKDFEIVWKTAAKLIRFANDNVERVVHQPPVLKVVDRSYAPVVVDRDEPETAQPKVTPVVGSIPSAARMTLVVTSQTNKVAHRPAAEAHSRPRAAGQNL